MIVKLLYNAIMIYPHHGPYSFNLDQ